MKWYFIKKANFLQKRTTRIEEIKLKKAGIGELF